jgi:hypothetical protein
LRFMSKLRYVTDQELIDKSLRRHGTSRPRPLWQARACAVNLKHGANFEGELEGWEFTPNVDPGTLPLLSYDTVADVNGRADCPGACQCRWPGARARPWPWATEGQPPSMEPEP